MYGVYVWYSTVVQKNQDFTTRLKPKNNHSQTRLACAMSSQLNFQLGSSRQMYTAAVRKTVTKINLFLYTMYMYIVYKKDLFYIIHTTN